MNGAAQSLTKRTKRDIKVTQNERQTDADSRDMRSFANKLTSNESSLSPIRSTLSAVTLAQGQAIAENEHVESVVIASNVMTINGEKTYEYVFDDGWKAHIRAVDGTVVD